MPLAEWPDSHQAAWLTAIGEIELLGDGGRAAHWRQQTRKTNIQHYGRWLGWLALSGRLDVASSPAALVTPDNVADYHRCLSSIVAPRTRLSHLVGLKVVIQAMEPDVDWAWFQKKCNKIQRSAPASREKWTRVRPSGEIVAATLVYLRGRFDFDLPLDCVAYRNGVLLAIAASRPLRPRNLSSLEMGNNLVQRGDKWWIQVPADETKTSQPIDYDVPAFVVPVLEHYVNAVRTRLLSHSSSQRLWINLHGRDMSANSIYLAITGLTQTLLGVSINPHLLRDCAATMMANESPEHARLAAPFLSHRFFSTTERYYIHAEYQKSVRRVGDILESVRAGLKQDRRIKIGRK